MVEPYSQALYEVASENHKEDVYRTSLQQLAQVWKDNQELVQFLKHPKVLRQQKEDLLRSMIAGQVDETLERFIYVCNAHDVSAYLPEIYDAYVDCYYRAHHIEKVKVVSATDLDETQIASLKNVLEKKLNKKIECDIRVDASLIAGMRVQTSQFVLDNTILSKAETMKEQIRNRN